MRSGIIPREHGSYVVLATSIVIGVLASNAPAIDRVALVVIASVAAFFAQQPLRTLLIRRGARASRNRAALVVAVGCSIVATIAFALLVIERLSVIAVVPVALTFGWMLLRSDRRRMSIAEKSMIGLPVLALAAPLMQLATGDTNALSVAGLWLMVAGFFVGSSTTVRIRLGATGLSAIIYTIAFIAVAIALFAFGAGTVPLWIAGVQTVKLAWVLHDVDAFRVIPLRRIGVIETLAALLLLVGFLV